MFVATYNPDLLVPVVVLTWSFSAVSCFTTDDFC